MSKKEKIEHERLESTMATAVALYNEWVIWCIDNGINSRHIAIVPKLFTFYQDEISEKNPSEGEKG